MTLPSGSGVGRRSFASAPRLGRASQRPALTLLAALLLALGVSSCDRPYVEPIFIQGPGDLIVTGFVTNRVDGEAVEGSRMDFLGYGSMVLWQRIHHGRYQVHGMAESTYEAVIDNNPYWTLHVEHRTLRVNVRPNQLQFDFSVLVFGSRRFGVTYDQEFDRFFHELARHEGAREVVWKWLAPPNRIYVTTQGLSDQDLEEFLSVLDEVNSESVEDMYGGRTGPFLIQSGPAVRQAGPDTVVVSFHYEPSRTDLTVAANGSITGARVRFSAETLGPTLDPQMKKARIAHELWHCAGATDVTDPRSLMHSELDGSVAALSPRDKLAAYLHYHPDTHPGNRAPDTNPSYRP